MFSNDRNQLRKLFFTSWQKALNQEPLEPLEQQIVQVIRLHPEYHNLLQNLDSNLTRDYPVEAGVTNPFLHMSLHMALLEQLQTNRPSGIREVYHKLCQRYGDAHQTEHAMIEILAEHLWLMQNNPVEFNENYYLAELIKLINLNQ